MYLGSEDVVVDLIYDRFDVVLTCKRSFIDGSVLNSPRRKRRACWIYPEGWHPSQ